MKPSWYFITINDPVFRREMSQLVFEYLQTFPTGTAKDILEANELPSVYEEYINQLIVEKLNRGA